jgi:hypothetical protein
MAAMKDTHKKDQPSSAKVIELIGSSTASRKEATENAVEAAVLAVRNITGVDLQRYTKQYCGFPFFCPVMKPELRGLHVHPR